MNKMKFSLDPESGMLSENDAKRYFSVVGFATGVFMLVYYVSSLALVLALSYYAPHWLENGIVYQLLSLIPLYGLAFPCFYLILKRLPSAPPAKGTMGVAGALGGFCISMALMMAGNSIGNTLTLLFESLSGRLLTNPVEEMTVGQHWWVNLIFVGILAPVLEELVFRKLLCRRLLPLGEGYAVVISAAIFGLVHGNFFQFFYAFALGLVFAYIYVKTGKIRYSMVYHMLINVMGGVLAPWILERLTPMLNEEFLEQMVVLAEAENYEAWMALVSPYMTPMLALTAYELVMFGAGLIGLGLLLFRRKRIRFEKGTLPPPQTGRVANVFLNVGVASALTVFTVIFLLSLL